jgi:hypothetical protein
MRSRLSLKLAPSSVIEVTRAAKMWGDVGTRAKLCKTTALRHGRAATGSRGGTTWRLASAGSEAERKNRRYKGR